MSLQQTLKKKNNSLDILNQIQTVEGQSTGKLENTAFFAKDAICVEGIESTAGSKVLEDYKPKFTATVVQKMLDAGADLHGKTQQDEFGFGTFCLNCQQGNPKNPVDPERVVGGSSGGAGAVCKALDQDVISLGESTGGSITNPAAYNGVNGLTPTYGKVSRSGLISYSNSMDKIGVLSQSLDLIETGLQVISGKDSRDQTTQQPSNQKTGDKNKLAIPNQLLDTEIEDGVLENFQASVNKLEDAGYQVDKVDIPMLNPDYCVPSYYILAMSEASTNLAKYSGMRYGAQGNPKKQDFNSYFSQIRKQKLGEEAKRRILLGTFSRMTGYRDDYYIKAAKARNRLIRQVKQVFEDYDAYISPSMPNIAPKIEEAREMPPEKVYAMDAMTVGPNLGGFPMISVPNGQSQSMPTGLHIVGDHWTEQKLIELAREHKSQ